MRNKIQNILALPNFFRIIKSADDIQYNLKLPSILLINNVYYCWLQSILGKTHKNLTIYTNKKHFELNGKALIKAFGYLDNSLIKYDESILITHQSGHVTPREASELKLSIFVPQQEKMQYFIQWQRYRKYWWSSISTTPSLFAINEINYENDTANATIIAKFPWDHHTVETIQVDSVETIFSQNDKKIHNMAHLSCSMSLESALFTLLLDGFSDNIKEDYLRLHRSIAPYKISFALNITDEANKATLSELAKLMHHKLRKNNISSFLPNFTLRAEQQIKENLQLGVAYTAVLCENTLVTGILNLMNSNTMLKEQVHLADFDMYAGLLFKS